MKHLYLNLKRFDIPPAYGGVNRLAPGREWGACIVERTQEALSRCDPEKAEFVQFFPEAHIIGALSACRPGGPVRVGCQGVCRADTAAGGNFGAFTTNRTANSMRALGCVHTIIGHCEERMDKRAVMAEAGAEDAAAVNRLLNQEIRRAQEAGLQVLYCIGETAAEQPRWEEVLAGQLDVGLEGVDKSGVVIAYEPVWSIGPGKTPAGKDYITRIARFVKERAGGIDVVYGGGLKQDNAAMLSSIPEIDGGLIALTRFQGEIGFYPEEYLDIIRLYLGETL